MLLRRHKRNEQGPVKTAPEANNGTTSDNEKKTYTKTEINRLSTAELQALALENGIGGADGMTGADLKKVLIEKFGL